MSYYISYKNLLFCEEHDEAQVKGEWSKVKGFCCSSLCAAFYKKAGIINYKGNIHKVKPGHFQENNNFLKYNEDYSLGHEQEINFV